MKIVLKKDWDENLNAPFFKNTKKTGHFFGRAKEVEFLTNDILRKTSGSVLVYGYRGVGKSSLVNEALWKVRDQNPKIIYVSLNGPQLEGQYNVSNDPRVFIQNLIRRLYVETREISDLDLKKDIDNLYIKAVAQEYKISHSSVSDDKATHKQTVEHSHKITLDNKFLTYILSIIVGILIQFDLLNKIPEVLQRVLAIIFFIPIPYIYSYLRKSVSETQKDETTSSGDYYSLDNSLPILENDLEELHQEFQQTDRKVVYIIDELDKVSPDFVKETLDYHKTLFTISKALFVLIGGYGLDSILNEANYYTENNDDSSSKKSFKDGHTNRSPAYTAFTSKYFIARPFWDELSEYLDAIVDEKDMDNKSWTILKKAICLDAMNDFFDLKEKIRDRFSTFNEGTFAPIIEVDDISEEDKIKALYYTEITSYMSFKHTYEKPSIWRTGELIWFEIFNHFSMVFHSKIHLGSRQKDKTIQITGVNAIFNEFILGILRQMENKKLVLIEEKERKQQSGFFDVRYELDVSKLDDYFDQIGVES